MAAETSKAGLMTGTTAGDDGDAFRSIAVGATVDNLVGGVEGKRWVRQGQGVEGSVDEVGWVVNEVFSCMRKGVL